MKALITDVTVVAQSCVLFVLVTLLWIHRSKPRNISRSTANSLLIAFRIIVIHCLVLVVLVPFSGIAAVTVPFVALAGLCLFPFATIEAIPGGNASAYSVGKMLLIPVYVIRQFAIGFPDRDLLTNRRPEPIPIGDEPTPFWVDDE